MNFPSMNSDRLDINVLASPWCEQFAKKPLRRNSQQRRRMRREEKRGEVTRGGEMRHGIVLKGRVSVSCAYPAAQRMRFNFFCHCNRLENSLQVLFELKLGTPQVKCSTASDLGQVCCYLWLFTTFKHSIYVCFLSNSLRVLMEWAVL